MMTRIGRSGRQAGWAKVGVAARASGAASAARRLSMVYFSLRGGV
jgi:hypothetical protein